MEIVEGKFYRTRDGRKVGPMRRQSNGWVADSGRIDDNGEYDWYMSGNYDCYNQETSVDLIAEWQDEPKKEISDMSEVKFKVGDFIRKPLAGWNKQGYEVAKIVGSLVYLKPYPDSSSIHSYDIGRSEWEIVKSEANTSVPEFGTKWVFNDGQDFVVRVVGFNDKGQIVLETLISDGSYDLGEYFAFEGGNENFGNFYKPWVEKAEKQKIVGYVTVVKEIGTGRLDFDGSVFDTEQEARDGFDSWTGAWELVDVVKVEWEES